MKRHAIATDSVNGMIVSQRISVLVAASWIGVLKTARKWKRVKSINNNFKYTTKPALQYDNSNICINPN